MPDEIKPEESVHDADKLLAERDEYLAGWQRAKADLVNYKKDEFARSGEIARMTAERLLRDVIGILDSFDLGLRSLEEKGPVEKGIYLIRAQCEDLLKRHGVERIPLAPGDSYDPASAEAIGETPSPAPPGTIADVIEPGYRMGERVIRAARVVLSKGSGHEEISE
jgi:molecular chaperone GrpE